MLFVYKDLFTFSSSVRAIKGHEDVTIRVSDQGGGIPRRKTDLLFEYLYTTAPTPQLLSSCDMPGNFGMGTPAPIAGHGYGLPLSRYYFQNIFWFHEKIYNYFFPHRLYARYFNGDLTLSSIEGYGTEVFVYLQALESEAKVCFVYLYSAFYFF